MLNYAVEVVFVIDPNGNECAFVTARDDNRTDKALAVEVPRYFKSSEYKFVRKIVVADGLSKDQAEQGRKDQLAVYERCSKQILNVKDAASEFVA
jgi:hypothetical protein